MTDYKKGEPALAAAVLAVLLLLGCSGQSGVQVPIQARTNVAQQQPLEVRVKTVQDNPNLTDAQKQTIIAKMRSKSSSSGSGTPQ